MTNIDKFTKEGFSVLNTENKENKLINFFKENYPSIIKDNEIDINELKAIAGLPIDEKVNGYGLNFVGRNVARAKYAQKTDKELSLNRKLSKNIDTTQNLLLKGDNLDSLKILKNHYNGKIKCIYIDPPYNTTSDEFVYPDRFNKEEAEVLGLANIGKDDMERMEFSFKSKKSHNGWLSFMYPRLLLARDLLSKEGVIFISIDDNEQANLKLLCDDVFGDENFVGQIIWHKKTQPSFLSKEVATIKEYILFYKKTSETIYTLGGYTNPDKNIELLNISNSLCKRFFKKENILIKSGNFSGILKKGLYGNEPLQVELLENLIVKDGKLENDFYLKGRFKWGQEKINEAFLEGDIFHLKNPKSLRPTIEKKNKLTNIKPIIDIFSKKFDKEIATNTDASREIEILFNKKEIFSNPKPTKLIKYLLKSITYSDKNSIIIDFFAGSGTTGQAVMQLNAEDGGNRKFILCQIDEPIKKKKPAYKFCKENNLPPVISSITVERLKRASEKIAKEIEAKNKKTGMFEENKKQAPDVGYKVFDSVDAPKLIMDGEQIEIKHENNDTLSRIYNMVFSVGVDKPTKAPETVVEDCIYKIGTNYYLTNSEKINSHDFSNAIKNGKVFIDGWTANLNGTLQNYKEDVKIVF